MSISQWLIKIVRKGGLVWKTDVHTFSNGPRTPDTSYNTVDDSLYVTAETPQPRWFVSKTDKDYDYICLSSSKHEKFLFKIIRLIFNLNMHAYYYFICVVLL